MSDFDNLNKLDNFKIETIQDIIKKRFEDDIIYTNCGRILISLNPFKNLAIYDKEHLEKYHDNIEDEYLQPHVYQLAENAYQNMLEGDKNQGILISGESGAGKTEISKHILKKIIYKRNQKKGNLEEKVNKTNDILESFGNAKTILNWNSSRFGKLTEIFFDERGKVKRAVICEYMLEKSRLIKQNQNESNFHIFYAFLKEDLSRYKITKETDYRIFSHPHPHDQPTSYKNIIKILKDLNFEKEDIKRIEKSLAAIIHITSINFEDDNGKIQITTEDAVANVAELMGLDLTELMNVLLEKKLMAPDDIVSTIKSKKQAEEERDAFAKSLYSRLFAWIIAKMNSSLSSSNMRGSENSISILDMSGFESLERNSFEQFVINFTNEKLQCYLEKHIFTMEMELYKEEGIQLLYKNDKFTGNEEILNMFEKSPSLLLIIDEQTHFPESNSDTLFTKLNKTFGNQKYYEKKDVTGFFAIHHFAGKVTYEIDSFLIKNRDEICNDLIMCAKGSSDEFFSRLFRAQRDITGSIGTDPTTLGTYKSGLNRKKLYGMMDGKPTQSLNVSRLGEKRTKTVISYMKVSLFMLVQKLNASELHFIRCIRPNSSKENNVFERALVEKQLYYTGIADAAEIFQTGYPFRKTYSDFINTYTVFSKDCKSITEKEKVEEMLEKANINPSDYCLGKNMIFMKDSVHFTLRKEQKAHQEVMASEIQAEDNESDGSSVMSDTINDTREPSIDMSINIPVTKEEDFDDESDYVDSHFAIERLKGSLRRRKGSKASFDRTISLSDLKGDFGLKDYRKPSFVSDLSYIEDEEDEDEPEEEKPEWDHFEMFQEDPKRGELQHSNFMIYLKLFLYLLFFLAILASSVIQKLTLHMMTKLYAYESGKENMGYTLLSIAICIPYGIGLLFSFHKFAFNSEKKSTFSVIMMALIPETFHSIGLCIFLFYISSKLDILCQIVLLNSIGIIPSLSKMLFTKRSKEATTRYASGLKDCFTFIFHAGALAVLLFFNDDLFPTEKIITYICLVFVSINSWENFYEKCSFSMKLNKNLETMISILYKRKGLANTIVYIWKILLTLLVGYLLKFHDFGSNFQDLDQGKWLLISPKLAIILLTCCTALGYYISYLACRLRMQRFSFSLPLLLSTPASVVAYFVLDSQDETVVYDYSKFFTMNKIIVMGCGAMLYITFQIIVSYIWYPKNSRLERHEKLFVSPTYCSVFYEQTLLLDRKRSDTSQEEEERIDVENEGSDRSEGRTRNTEKVYPRIYACATMWHENENEIMQLLKSIFRMAIEQTLVTDIKMATEGVGSSRDYDDYYDFEAHIFFDDAMEINDFEDVCLNKYVKTLVTTIDKAASSVMKCPTTVHPPCKIITPYGGQLLWQIQENVLLFVHLKDKKKIRNKKRWSQVMYMYYLLAHRLPMLADERVNLVLNARPFEFDLDKIRTEEIMKIAKKTYILALDGDVDFQPDAVEKLLDLMKNDKKLGAACGRIHPMGKGPMIWFQIFEYAIGHWYQKATEHVLGCVLCSPGCFSLFRGSALMDMNVMRKYTILPTEPQHHLQFDQGEDRWLCTLLLQQGYKIGYCAAADAYTFAPETFNEFFNQRRRWMPSTIANVLDLLASYKLTVQKNDNVSIWFILYQLFIMMLTIIGPGTVMMMIAVSLDSVFQIGIPLSYLLVLIPNILFGLACFYLKTETQLVLASLQSAIYTFIMLAVMVGVIIQAAETSVFNPGVIVILSMTILVTLSGLLHLQELYCLICGIVYFICIPLGYLILVIYSMSNMHIVSWGTREKKLLATTEEIKPNANETSVSSTLSKMLGISELMSMVKNLFYKDKKEEDNAMLTLLREMNENIKALSDRTLNEASTTDSVETMGTMETMDTMESMETMSLTKSKSRSYRSMNKSKVRFFEEEGTTPEKKGSPHFWMKHSCLGNGLRAKLSKTESKFWKQFITKYLYPLEFTKEEEERGKENLLYFRTSCCHAMTLLNLMWMVINFMFQYRKPFMFTIPREEDDVKIEPFSFLFLSLFAFIFALQFFGMILHRLETFFHIISCTNIISEQADPHTPLELNNIDQREVVRKMRYSLTKSVKSTQKSAFTRKVSERIRKMSTHGAITLHETLRKRNLATVISPGKHKNSIPSMAMSKKIALSYNSSVDYNEESHL
ncbi:chitin synthase chs-1-like [Octopus vulgaris]|uniref:chitin synthase n=1 Tax=Octopus vulgaris TaxID=6645 RepID=A0AA36AYA5_OCTVU|nr:chitin synthase chs-1-like [Octopus vulgaris]